MYLNYPHNLDAYFNWATHYMSSLYQNAAKILETTKKTNLWNINKMLDSLKLRSNCNVINKITMKKLDYE